MSGILERFFQVALLLTLILFAMNASISVFGEVMTGEKLVITTQDISGVDLNLSTSVIQQTETPFTSATQDPDTWEFVLQQLQAVGFGYRPVFDRIFNSIGLELIGTFLINILTILQVVGVAYLFWALISAWRGGGSP